MGWRLALAGLGVFLLGLNLLGLVAPFRAASAPTHPETPASKPTDRPGWIRFVTREVHARIAHRWPDTQPEARAEHLQLPPRENYLLYLAGFLAPDPYARYEFCRASRALQRGVGLCSQQAIVAVQLLEAEGIPARIVALDGHVVASAQVDPAADAWWLLDPDYGAVIEHDLAHVEADPQAARAAYVSAGLSPELAAQTAAFYEPTGNQLWPSVWAYCSPQRYLVEHLSYGAIWVLPILLLLPALRRWRRGSDAKQGPAAP